jgi:hypothetical protein
MSGRARPRERDGRAGGETVTPLELFFDLVFGFAITQVTALGMLATVDGLSRRCVRHRHRSCQPCARRRARWRRRRLLWGQWPAIAMTWFSGE